MNVTFNIDGQEYGIGMGIMDDTAARCAINAMQGTTAVLGAQKIKAQCEAEGLEVPEYVKWWTE